MTDDEETQRIRRPEADDPTAPMPRAGEPDLFRARVEPEPENQPWWDPSSEDPAWRPGDEPTQVERSWDEAPTEVVRSRDSPAQPTPPSRAGETRRMWGFRSKRSEPEPAPPVEPWADETHQMPTVPSEPEPRPAPPVEPWADRTHQMPAVRSEPSEPAPEPEPVPVEPWADQTYQMPTWQPEPQPVPEPVAGALPVLVPEDEGRRKRGRRARAEPDEVDEYHSGGGQSSRDEILMRVRGAIGGRPEPDETIVRNYRRELDLGPEALLDLFAERVADYQARVRRVPRAEVAAAIAVCLVERGIRAIAVPEDVPAFWLPQYVDSVVDDGRLGPADLDRVDGALTGCALGIAETGTIVLDGGRRQGRRMLSLVPDYHLCVVNAHDVVGTVPEAMDRLDPIRPVTFVSGPSATSDIELERIEGVHGPRRLDVLIAE